MKRYLALATFLAGCNSDGRDSDALTNRQACSRLVRAECDYLVRCGEWASTSNECQTALMVACCEDEECGWAAEADSDRVNACVALANGSTCDNPYVSQDCQVREILGSRPTAPTDSSGPTIIVDAGPTGTTGNTGGGAELYAECVIDSSCSSAAEGCFRFGSKYLCTQRCNTSADCPSGARCIDQTYEPAVCVPSCTGDLDCPRHMLCDTYYGYCQ